MLEASSHQQLKALFQREGLQSWPHHLTLSRLVGRSLRRGDHTVVRLQPGTDPSWLISLLVPLALSECPLALLVSDALRQRLLRVEWPRLRAAELSLPCWEGSRAPEETRIWLLNHRELVEAWQEQRLGRRQLVIPEAETLEVALRAAMEVVVEPRHWELLRRAKPSAAESLLTLHQRLSQRVLTHPRQIEQRVALEADDEAPLRHLLALLDPLPDPWPQWLEASGPGWCSWARVEPAELQWRLHRQPLNPLWELKTLLLDRGVVLTGEMGSDGAGNPPAAAFSTLGLTPQVMVALGDPLLVHDPLPVYAPLGQPLPNSPHYAEHLLNHCLRLVLGQGGLSVVLVDDAALLKGLASGLAAEFGKRVTLEHTSPDSNGVLCASWSWWLDHQDRLPLPCQVLVGLLPIASLEDPLTAAKVSQLRRQGRDWFRELLLPDALNRLQRSVAGLRRNGGRLAVLDGRLRSRGWGRQVFTAMEPWVQLSRLLPD